MTVLTSPWVEPRLRMSSSLFFNFIGGAMSTSTQHGGGLGFAISFTPDELSQVHGNGRSGKANMREIRAVVGRKILRTILPAYHNVPPPDVEKTLKGVEVVRVSLLSSNQKRAGPLVEIIYRFPGAKSSGHYRHVFHFVSERGGLSGKLYTQTRKYSDR
jgi:hypothetical protein